MSPFKAARPPLAPEPDKNVVALTENRLNAQIRRYERLLDDKESELAVHDYLASHSYFFNGVLRMFGSSPLYSKVKFADKFEADFVWFDSGSYGCEWHLAEIEAPARKMFTKSGRASGYLTHAIQQVRDWHTWVHEHRSTARELMPHVDYPQGYVFIGRRRDLSESDMQRLKRLSFEHRMMLEIHTLDWFASNAASVRNLLGRSRWRIPSRAFTHADLRRRQPDWAFEWLDSPATKRWTQRHWQLRRNNKDYDYVGQAEWPDRNDNSLRKEERARRKSKTCE